MSKIGFSSSKYFETPLEIEEVRKLLEKTDSDKDNMEGLKHLLAVCSYFFLNAVCLRVLVEVESRKRVI